MQDDRLKVMKWVNINEATCHHCLHVWYEQGLTDPEQIKEESLKKRAATVQEGAIEQKFLE